jgi:hypothetical protein
MFIYNNIVQFILIPKSKPIEEDSKTTCVPYYCYALFF